MEKLNISAKSADWRAKALSNFSEHHFILEGELFASVEGFIQGIKFPENDNDRKKTFALSGMKAKKMGRKSSRRFIWWKGKRIPYNSPAHRALIERAINAKFWQNESAMEALLSTKKMELIHDLGYPESPTTSLPADIFCKILTDIRDGKNKTA